jgi:hypothetical protein
LFKIDHCIDENGKIKFVYEKIEKMAKIGGYPDSKNKAQSNFVNGHTFHCKICRKKLVFARKDPKISREKHNNECAHFNLNNLNY